MLCGESARQHQESRRLGLDLTESGNREKFFTGKWLTDFRTGAMAEVAEQNYGAKYAFCRHLLAFFARIQIRFAVTSFCTVDWTVDCNTT
jgi:hypothetical protein